MRIAVVVNDLSIGGAERNAVNYAASLGRRGHEVHVVAGGGPLRRDLDDTRVRYAPVAARFRRPWQLVAAAITLRGIAARSGLDVVHCFMASSAVAAKLARWAGARFAIVSSPPGATQDPNEPWPISEIRLRALAGASDIILSPSAHFRTMLKRRGVSDRRIVDLQFNAIPLSQYEATDADALAVRQQLGLHLEDRIVCAVARLHPVKRLDLLLRAAPLVLERVPETRFVLVGDGPARSQLEALARRLGVSDAVRLAGSRRDVGAVLRAADVLVQTTYGFGGPGLSTLEAFAASRPVVCLDSGDRAQAIGDSGGTLLVREGDIAGLAAAIADLLTDPERAMRMGARGRIWAERHFDLERVADALEALYEGVVASRRRIAPEHGL